MNERSQSGRALRWVIGLSIAVTVIYALSTVVFRSPSSSRRAPSEADSLQTAEVAATDRRDRHFDVAVPQSNPLNAAALHEETVRQGEVIEFSVTSTRPGAVVVHGLLEPHSVVLNGQVVVAFRAIYTGRFPLHFHGDDGSHVELIALNVMPSGKS